MVAEWLIPEKEPGCCLAETSSSLPFDATSSSQLPFRPSVTCCTFGIIHKTGGASCLPMTPASLVNGVAKQLPPITQHLAKCKDHVHHSICAIAISSRRIDQWIKCIYVVKTKRIRLSCLSECLGLITFQRSATKQSGKNKQQADYSFHLQYIHCSSVIGRDDAVSLVPASIFRKSLTTLLPYAPEILSNKPKRNVTSCAHSTFAGHFQYYWHLTLQQ